MFNWIRRRQPASRVRPKCRLSLESLEDRRMLSTVPVMGTLTDQTLPNGGPLFVPVISSDGDNSLVSYSVSSSDPNVTVIPRQGFGYLDIKVKGFGDMIFQLYSDISPNTVAAISTLVQQGFYTNLTINRVVPNFVIQGGDPLGNGTGGPGFGLPTETGPLSQFNGTGQLSLANSIENTPSVPDSNGSQFFVTIGPQPAALNNGDFTLLGQLVRGFDVENAIANVPLDPNSTPPTPSTPTTPPVILSATIIPDYTDTVLQIVAPAGYNADPTITVTATSSAGSSTQSFHMLVGNGGIDLQRIQFVNRAFSTILGRPAEQSAVNYYTGLLANNQATTGQIALQIQTSLEARMNEVKTLYQTLLNRAPDLQALQANTLFLMQGGTVAQLEANITASQEFFEAQGGSNSAWIDALFKDANGATSVPISYVNQVSTMLDQGLKRTDYAETIFTNISANVFTVQNLFNTFLERTPTIQDALPLAQEMNAGVSEDLIVATIVGSDEFFNFTKNQNAGSG
jgi:cyclophilin family peptidyl-prolyl cis-trans isomerase